MMPVTGGLVCLATLTTTNAFVAPLAARYGTPLASSASQAALRMSSEGGDDTPLVFPRSSLAFLEVMSIACICLFTVYRWVG